jgi:hypothetical protein
MSVMERRLQLLLDQPRYDRVASAAKESGRSVAAVIRDAIDLAYPGGEELRAESWSALLLETETPSGPAEDWATIKEALLDDREAKLR